MGIDRIGALMEVEKAQQRQKPEAERAGEMIIPCSFCIQLIH